MKRFFSILGLLIILIALIYLLKGVPDKEIPYPELQQTDTLRGFS